VPLERQWERQTTPLRALGPRERRILALVGGLLAIAVAVIVIVGVTGGDSSEERSDCVEAIAPSTTGGVKIHACGAKAVRFCRSQARLDDPVARRVQATCREKGIL
jgi:hypothetical protein